MSRDRKYLKKIKKDYQSKNLCNPFFHKAKKKPEKNILILVFVSSFLLLIFLIWFFLSSPVWKINNIQVEGLTRFSDNDLKNKIFDQMSKSRYGLFSQSNIWLFDKSEVEENILSAYNFSNLKIVKKPAHTLLVKVGERPYAFIFQEGTGLFYASVDAYIIRESAVSEEDRPKYLILENKSSSSLINEQNKLNISETYLNFILDLANKLTKHQELSVEKFIIDSEFNTIKVKFREGPLVYFNTKTDAEEQINRLVLVKKEKIKDNFSKTSYIDLRYGDRIFIN